MQYQIFQMNKVHGYRLFSVRACILSKIYFRENTETLTHAFVSSRIDYCNRLLYSMSNCHPHKLEREQKCGHVPYI